MNVRAVERITFYSTQCFHWTYHSKPTWPWRRRVSFEVISFSLLTFCSILNPALETLPSCWCYGLFDRKTRDSPCQAAAKSRTNLVSTHSDPESHWLHWHIWYNGCVLLGLGATEFTNLIGWTPYWKWSRFSHLDRQCQFAVKKLQTKRKKILTIFF